MKLCFQSKLGQMEENRRQLADWETDRCREDRGDRETGETRETGQVD